MWVDPYNRCVEVNFDTSVIPTIVARLLSHLWRGYQSCGEITLALCGEVTKSVA